MNEIRPTLGFEFTNEYNDAKKKVFDCIAAINKLSPEKQESLAKECASILGASASLQQFIDFIKNRR